MFVLPGYIIHEEIYENNRIRIYRGRTVQDQMPVIIKVLKQETANPVEISRFIYEYEITRNLEIEGIIKPVRLEKAGKALAIIMEDTGDVSLREYIGGNTVELSAFFDIAVQLARILGEIHQNGIIHRNLKPENVLVHPVTGKVKITDFSEAVHFSMNSENSAMFSALPENSEYMPPEQIVRVKGAADYRSDFYSLGVLFYEMLTGQLPLQAADHGEWIHIHLSRKPEAPDKINPGIPPTLSAVIMKLLSKNADERYQSAWGLVRDLEECRRQWNITGRIEPFTLGQMDVFSRFELPRKLFGREMEAETLKTSFERTCADQGEFVLVSGYAGAGKTVLINEILKPLAMEKGYFAYGKFDQLQQNIPYAPFASAVGNMIRQLMTESREKVDIWRMKILRALGHSGAVITELVPALEMIIGRQPPVEVLQPREAQNRFLMAFGNFIKVFARKEHPLVIFLDDLQWADMASLQLLKYLCGYTDMNHLLIVGAFRDNEIGENHPLPAILEEVRKEGIPVRGIYLNHLNRKEVTEFVAETLHCPEEKSVTLAETLYRKTWGNPFFLGQLLKSVYDEKLITFNIDKGCWEWKTESIRKLQMPDDVAGLILIKLKKLPEKTLGILKMASCMGNTFDLKTLSTVCEKTQDEISSLLLPAIMEGLVLPVSHACKVLPASYHNTVADINEFLHDRIKQAVYSLFSEEEKKEAHVKVGHLILQNISEDELDEKILTIVDHLNRSLDLINDPGERLKLAGYNLTAGRKAKASAAYDSAMNCFRAGMKLLPENAWDDCYSLCYDLHLERALCEYMVGDIDEAEKLFDIMLSRAETEFERTDLYGMKMILYTGTGKYAEAVRIGLNALKKLGMSLPANPGMFDNLKELLLYKWHMRNKKIEELAELPEMKHPVQRKIAELLIKFIFVTSTNYPDLYAFAIIKAGNHALRYGNSEMASIGYIGYSIIEGSVLGNYKVGHEMGKVAIALAEKYDKSLSKCIVYFTIGAIILHWTHHAKKGLEYLHKAIDCSFEAGDVLIAGYSYGVILENKYLMGTPLGEILEEARKCSNYARKVKHENLGINAAVYERLVSVLTGRTGILSSKDPQDFDEEEFFKSVKGDKASLVAHYYSKMQLCYLSGNYREALYMVERIKNFAGVIIGFLMSAECNFYHSLTITAVYGELPSEERKRFMKTLKKNQRRMKKWSNSCAANFLHKYLLVEAEMSRVFGRKQEAGTLYDKAIQSARESGYIQNEACACELAARFYAAEGRVGIAKAYMSDAISLYRKWGAEAKVQDLKWRYPDLLKGVMEENEGRKYDSAGMLKNILRYSVISESEAASTLDISTIHKAIRSISEQSDADKLPETFLKIAMESVCANKGYLILEKNDELFIEAAKDNESSTVSVVKPIPLGKSNNLSRLMVNYVARTLEPVIVNNDEQIGIFAKDPYIVQSGVKSVACVPLQLRGIPAGVLYLENSFMSGVFTEERIELLELLSGQMMYVNALQAFLERDRSGTKDPACMPPADSLTEREKEVLGLIAAGLSNKEIAERLEMTVNTVKTHIKNIYSKLQVNRRVQVVESAKKLNIL